MPAKSLELKHTIKLIQELTSEINEKMCIRDRPPALLDGHTMPEKQGGKLIKAGSNGKGFPDSPAQLRLIRFKLGLPGRDTVRSNRGVGSVKRCV